MVLPIGTWDETNPAGTRKINLGDNDIRQLKSQVREVIAVDHEFTSTQSADTGGQHKQVTLQDAADIGTGATGVPILGAQGAEDAAELTYTNEADTDIVITNQTGINAPSITGVYAVDNLAAIAAIGTLLYPVGSVYANAAVSTNPATLLGFGTWVAIEGECVVGLVAGGEFDTLGSVSEGETTHTLSEAELPAHTHDVTARASRGDNSGASSIGQDGAYEDTTFATSSVGSGTAHNNIQPSYVCYVWRRTV